MNSNLRGKKMNRAPTENFNAILPENSRGFTAPAQFNAMSVLVNRNRVICRLFPRNLSSKSESVRD